jgi:hypothetical protein
MRICIVGSIWPASESPSRDFRRASAGWGSDNAIAQGLAFNEMVASGELKAPIVIGRDHLDTGSVASPTVKPKRWPTARMPSPIGRC